MVGSGWVNRSPESKMKILLQVKQMIQEMKSISSPPNKDIANVDGGSLFDSRLSGPSLQFGSFCSVQDFHKHLRGGIELHPNLDPELKELIAQHGRHWPLLFTHGDLSSLKIIDR